MIEQLKSILMEGYSKGYDDGTSDTLKTIKDMIERYKNRSSKDLFDAILLICNNGLKENN